MYGRCCWFSSFVCCAGVVVFLANHFSFRDLIPVEWIRLFNPHELQRLIGGEGGRAVDVEDLKRNTLYAGGYHQSQPVMQVRTVYHTGGFVVQ